MAEKLNKLEDLFVDSLKDLYDAEHQITEALPKMIDAAKSQELKNSFKEHLDLTKKQAQRLEQVFKEMKMTPKAKKCKGMQGLIREGEEVMQEAADPYVRDAAMIASAQKIEHYEISGYGTARAYAEALGHQSIARILDQILEEESNADEKLTRIAESHINVRAKQ